jgi:hypothetical protein
MSQVHQQQQQQQQQQHTPSFSFGQQNGASHPFNPPGYPPSNQPVQQPQPQQQQQQQQQQYEAYRPSFQPGYQHQPIYNMQQNGMQEANYASLNMLTSQHHPPPHHSPPHHSMGSSLTVAADPKRNRRESAMMGMDIGLVGQRHPVRGLQDQ